MTTRSAPIRKSLIRVFGGDPRLVKEVETLFRDIEQIDVTEAVTLGTDPQFARADASSGALTITLPSAFENEGLIHEIKKVDVTANAVTIAPDVVTELIDGATSLSTSTPYEGFRLRSSGSGWDVMP